MVDTIEVALKYVGGGTFLVGIPARDLTAAEVKEHGGIVELCKTGLYERVAPKVEKKAKAAKVTKELEELRPPLTRTSDAYTPITWANISPPKDGE